VRQLVEQVLFTSPGERVFRPDFGAGARALVFEPNGTALADLVRKRLASALADALRGEVDPRTIQIDVSHQEERVLVAVSYHLAALGQRERVVLVAPGGSGG
jgi:phage baseplate assembly protein W